MMSRSLIKIGLVCIFFFSVPVQSDTFTFYQQQVMQAEVSEKILQKSIKQVKEHKDVKLRHNLSVQPFHKRNKQKKNKKQAFCSSCHLSLPHRKNERSRTFMNMHSRYITCETCHFRPKGIELEYRWLAFDGKDAGSEIAARDYDAVLDEKLKTMSKEKQKKSKRLGLAPLPQPLAPQLGARIAPFYDNVRVISFADSDFAEKTKQTWKDGSEQKRAELKSRLHVPLESKGAACQLCHGSKEFILDLEALGATAERAKEIQKNTIVRFFSRFKKDDQRIRINDLLR